MDKPRPLNEIALAALKAGMLLCPALYWLNSAFRRHCVNSEALGRGGAVILDSDYKGSRPICYSDREDHSSLHTMSAFVTL